jgi:tRNA A22 N-methylase
VTLTPSLASQNYDYLQVNDAENSTVNLGTDHGKLLRATLSQSSSESTVVSEYVKGVLVSDVTTPDNTSESKDLLSLLKPLIDDQQAKQDSVTWQQAFSSIHGMILLG